MGGSRGHPLHWPPTDFVTLFQKSQFARSASLVALILLFQHGISSIIEFWQHTQSCSNRRPTRLMKRYDNLPPRNSDTECKRNEGMPYPHLGVQCTHVFALAALATRPNINLQIIKIAFVSSTKIRIGNIFGRPLHGAHCRSASDSAARGTLAVPSSRPPFMSAPKHSAVSIAHPRQDSKKEVQDQNESVYMWGYMYGCVLGMCILYFTSE